MNKNINLMNCLGFSNYLFIWFIGYKTNIVSFNPFVAIYWTMTIDIIITINKVHDISYENFKIWLFIIGLHICSLLCLPIEISIYDMYISIVLYVFWYGKRLLLNK